MIVSLAHIHLHSHISNLLPSVVGSRMNTFKTNNNINRDESPWYKSKLLVGNHRIKHFLQCVCNYFGSYFVNNIAKTNWPKSDICFRSLHLGTITI